MHINPWDFMVKDTPSREWSEGSGVLIAVAFFCGGVASGLYLISLYFNEIWGMFIAWVFALGMGLFDVAHLHNKKMVWRMAMRPGSSWISRGFLLVTLFIGAAAIQMALTFWAPGTAAELVFKIFAGIAAFGVGVYSGFVLGYVNYIKIWNSAVMPVLFIVSGLVGGSAILLFVASLGGFPRFDFMKGVMLVALVAYTVIIGLHLWISSYNGPTSRNSVKVIVQNSLAVLFWLIVVFAGIVAPAIILQLAGPDSYFLLALNVVCVLSGNLALRYAILRAAMYKPLVIV